MLASVTNGRSSTEMVRQRFTPCSRLTGWGPRQGAGPHPLPLARDSRDASGPAHWAPCLAGEGAKPPGHRLLLVWTLRQR